jgi:hypothetical protein
MKLRMLSVAKEEFFEVSPAEEYPKLAVHT